MLGNVDRVILVVSFEKAIHKNLKKSCLSLMVTMLTNTMQQPCHQVLVVRQTNIEEVFNGFPKILIVEVFKVNKV